MKPGTVVIAEFPGVVVTKRRPSLIVSSDFYHTDRPDLILAVVSSQIHKATSKTDHILEDWSECGLVKPSFVRVFLFSVPKSAVTRIGELSESDWTEVQKRLKLAIEY